MYSSCSYSAKLAKQIVAEQKLKEQSQQERRHSAPVPHQPRREDGRSQRKRGSRPSSFRISRILREHDADLLDQMRMDSREQHQREEEAGDMDQSASHVSDASSLISVKSMSAIQGGDSTTKKGKTRGPKASEIYYSESDATRLAAAKSRRRKRSGSLGALTRAFGRLLSGEVYSSKTSTSVSSSSSSQPKNPDSTAQSKKEAGLVKQRKLMETVQFAEAVGELPLQAMNPDGGLCIIDDDNDDDGCGSASAAETVVTAISIPASNQPATSSSSGGSCSGLPTMVDVVVDNYPYQKHRRSFSRPKTRPQWPFANCYPGNDSFPYLTGPPTSPAASADLSMSGIQEQSLEVTQRGMARGNYAQLHRKAWLEVSDHYHRYGKHLRLYYRHWEALRCPTNQFFDWLDSKGDAAGQPLPNLDDCPRSILDCDMVLYITNPKVTEGYALEIVVESTSVSQNRDDTETVDEDETSQAGRILDVDGDPVQTGPDGWIFVIRDNKMYGGPKITSITGNSKQRFHHSSFFGGKAVAAAGIIVTDENGYLKSLLPHSGHYRPGESDMQRCLFFLNARGVDLRSFQMDVQQLMHVARDVKQNVKAKKVDSLELRPAIDVACFLAHKASCIGNGIFRRIQQIRHSDATTVSEALQAVDGLY